MISIAVLLVLIVNITINKHNDKTNYSKHKNTAYNTTPTKIIAINKTNKENHCQIKK